MKSFTAGDIRFIDGPRFGVLQTVELERLAADAPPADGVYSFRRVRG